MKKHVCLTWCSQHCGCWPPSTTRHMITNFTSCIFLNPGQLKHQISMQIEWWGQHVLQHFLFQYTVPSIVCQFIVWQITMEVNEPSQWGMTLHCNVIPHWLGAFTKGSLQVSSLVTDRFNMVGTHSKSMGSILTWGVSLAWINWSLSAYETHNWNWWHSFSLWGISFTGINCHQALNETESDGIYFDMGYIFNLNELKSKICLISYVSVGMLMTSCFDVWYII